MRQYLKELREEKGMCQQDVADSIGISRQYYSQIEDGQRQKKMEITLASALANALDTTLENIICNEQRIAKERSM